MFELDIPGFGFIKQTMTERCSKPQRLVLRYVSMKAAQ